MRQGLITGGLIIALGLALLASPPAFSAEKARGPSNEIVAKAPREFVAINNIHVPITADNGDFRLLQFDVWVGSDTPENAAKINSRKKVLVDAAKEGFKGHKWSEFTDPDTGLDTARELLKEAFTKVSQGVPIKEVLIDTMVLR